VGQLWYTSYMELNTTIYKFASTGKVWEWRTWVEDNGTHAVIHTLAGQQGMKQTSTEVPIWEGKNIGKANETSPYEQAVSQALSKMEKKLKGEYRYDVRDAAKGELKGGKAPMLAQKLNITGDDKNDGKTIQKMGIEFDVVGLEPKLDGLRSLIKIDEDNIQIRTRTGKVFQPIPHVEYDARQAYIDNNLSGEHEWDGELYTTEISFSKISGALRKEKKTPEHLHNLQFVKFHIYDIMNDDGYSERYKLITKFFGAHESPKYANIQPIEYHEVIATDEKLTEMMLDFINRGNEGMMLRRLDVPYENKRSWSLCKYKFFEEEEFVLADVLEDARGGFSSQVALKTTPYIDRDGKEKDTFNAGIKNMTHAECAELFINKANYIGKQVTIQFQELTDYGVPLFGKMKGVRIDAE